MSNIAAVGSTPAAFRRAGLSKNKPLALLSATTAGRHSLRGPQYSRVTFPQDRTSYERLPMSKQRRTADDFVRDMKAKQQHSTPGDIERKTSEGLIPEQAGAWRGNRGLTTWPIPTAARRNTRSRRSIS